MKKIAKLVSVFLAASVMTLTSCGPTAEEKAAAEAELQKAKTELATAEAQKKAVAEKAKKDALANAIKAEKDAQQAAIDEKREFYGLKAAYYLQAKADSLESTETMGNGKYDLGAGFPKALRDFNRTFANDSSYEYAGGLYIDRQYDGIKVVSEVVIRDKKTGATTLINDLMPN